MSTDVMFNIANKGESFELSEPEKAPAGVDKEILWSLWCIARALGPKQTKESKYLKIGEMDTYLAISVKKMQNARGVMILSKEKINGIEAQEHFFFGLQNDVQVYWHKKISPKAAQEIIKKAESTDKVKVKIIPLENNILVSEVVFAGSEK